MFLCSDLPQTYPLIDTDTSISVSAAHPKEKVPTVSKTQCLSSGINWLFNWINWISTWREGCSTPVVPIPLSLPLLTEKLLFHLLLQLDQNLGAPEQDMKLRVHMGLLLAMLLALVLLSQGQKVYKVLRIRLVFEMSLVLEPKRLMLGQLLLDP
jgi:hypothetical protein